MQSIFSLMRGLLRIRVPSYLYLGTVVVLLLIIFISSGKNSDKNMLTGQEGPREDLACPVNQVRLNDFELIKPLLFTENCSEDPNLLPVRAKLDSLIKEKVKRGDISGMSVFLKKLQETRIMNLNPADTYNPGSLMKLPVMITYFREAMKDPSVLTKKLLFTGHNYNLPVEEGAVSSLVKGQSYSIRQLIDLMIIESDNDAMALLINNIEVVKLNKIFNDLAVPMPATDHDFFSLTPEIYARFLRILYNATYLDKSYSQLALSILTNTKYNKGLTRDLKVKVAHKYGISTTGEFRSLSEAGIFYTDEPYLLVIMSKGGDYSKLSDAISECSHIVYNSLN